VLIDVLDASKVDTRTIVKVMGIYLEENIESALSMERSRMPLYFAQEISVVSKNSVMELIVE